TEQEPAVDVIENLAENSAEETAVADEELTAQIEAEPVADVADIEVQEEIGVAAVEDAPELRVEDDVAAAEEITDPDVTAEIETATVVEAVPMADTTKNVVEDKDGDSIAAKLQRIRAVVSRSDDIVEDNGYQEDEHAVDLVAKPEESIETAFDLDAENIAESVDVISDNQEEAYDDDIQNEENDNLFTEDAGFDSNEETTMEPQTDVPSDNENEIDARLIKVNRAELEAAIADDVVDNPEDIAPVSDEHDVALDAGLSDEDEAELQRELAEVGVAPETDAESSETVVAAETENHSGAKLLTEAANADDDMSRLMAKAESQMDEPESPQRRDAFSHLRAAVAATKAETTLRSDDDDSTSTEAYRDDLASAVVRPRRPDPIGTRTKRPGEARPAPLKLVAEQRIDTTGNEPRGPVRPRRVASDVLQNGEATIEEENGGFVEFASTMGATQLPDILEAAASYMAFVEGREQFSRPQLMHKVRQVEMQNFSREDGLRSFGKLLRAGKIEKIRGGRFTVSDGIGFKPDSDNTRAAG
ncbi:MAG: hypothetical protein ABJJ37_01810, partial [Roseibium sp.]